MYLPLLTTEARGKRAERTRNPKPIRGVLPPAFGSASGPRNHFQSGVERSVPMTLVSMTAATSISSSSSRTKSSTSSVSMPLAFQNRSEASCETGIFLRLRLELRFFLTLDLALLSANFFFLSAVLARGTSSEHGVF